MRLRPSLISLGLAIGLSLGLLYGLRIQPVTYSNMPPDALGDQYKTQITLMVAAAYHTDGDLERARQRLQLLGYTDPVAAVTALAQRTAADEFANPLHVQVLGELAFALGAVPVAAAETPSLPSPPTQPPLTDTPEPTIALSDTPAPPTNTPAPPPTNTPGVYDYTLLGQQPVCDTSLAEPQLQVIVQDAAGNPLPGVLVIVEWGVNSGRFYTGLKPEIGPGYGDFTITPGEIYTVRVGSQMPPVTNLYSEVCRTGDGGEYPGSVRLVFARIG